MASISSNPSSVVAAGTWTGGANVYTSNEVFATNTGATQNTEYPLEVGGFNFAAIPAGSTINSVTVTIEAKTGTAARAQIKGELLDGGTLLSPALALTNLTAADANYTFTPTATLAQLKSANLKVRVTNKRIVSQASTTSVDYVKIDVVYTAAGVVHQVSGTVAVAVDASGAVTVVLPPPAGSYKAFRFQTTAIRGGAAGNYMGVSEFQILVAGVRQAGATAYHSGGSPGDGGPEGANDNSVATKLTNMTVPGTNGYLYLVFPTGFLASAFRIATTNDSPERDPIAFDVYGSNDTPAGTPGTWTLIGSGTLPVDPGRSKYSQEFSLKPADTQGVGWSATWTNDWPPETAGAVTHQVSGTVAVSTGAAGAVSSIQQVAGTAPVAVGTTGAVRSIQQVSGSAPVVTGTAGTVRAILSVAGTVPVVVGANGDVTIVSPVVHQVSGTVAVATGTAGTVRAILSAAGIVPVTTAASGNVSVVAGAVTHQVSGTVAVATGAAGTVSRTQQVAGSAAVVTGAAGTAEVIVGAVIHQVSGTVAVSTAAAGAVDVVVGAVTHQVSGRVDVVTGTPTAPVSQRHAVSGAVAVTTTAAGTVIRRQQVSGTVVVATGAAGAVSSRQQVSGVVDVVSRSFGSASVVGQVPVTNVYLGDIPVTVALGDVPVKLA